MKMAFDGDLIFQNIFEMKTYLECFMKNFVPSFIVDLLHLLGYLVKTELLHPRFYHSRIF